MLSTDIAPPLYHPGPGRRALTAATVAVPTLDARTRDAAFELFARAYEGADRARFERDLAEKQLAILLRDHRTGELKGFSTVLLLERATARGAARVIFSGDTVIDPAYWGGKRLQSEFARLLLRLKLRDPGRPLYWFLISKGYRTYLLLANAFPRAVPRHDRREGGELRELLDAVAAERFGAQYDPDTGIVRYHSPHERVREGLAPIGPELLGNAHIRFFARRNPGHADGDELACLAEVRLRDLARVAARIGAARLRSRWGA